MLKVETKDKNINIKLGNRTILYHPNKPLKRCKYCGQEAQIGVQENRRLGVDSKGKHRSFISRTIFVGCVNNKCEAPNTHGQAEYAGFNKLNRNNAIRRCIKEWEEQN